MMVILMKENSNKMLKKIIEKRAILFQFFKYLR